MIDYAKFDRDQIEQTLKFAARSKLVGRIYVGRIGEQEVRWLDDGSVEVLTHHQPEQLPMAAAEPPKKRRPYRRHAVAACVAVLALAITAGTALAQQRTIYDGAGRVVGHSVTDSAGSTTFYDAGGRVTGRSATDSGGTTTIYDARGRNIGTETRRPGERR
jgi:YD repeat-containing protein